MANESAEFAVSDRKTFSVQMGGGDESVEVTDKNAVVFDSDDIPEDDEENKDDASADNVDSGEEGSGEDDASGDDDAGDGDASEDADDAELGAFDAEDPEVVAQYDAKYTKDGELDVEGALSAEYFANLENGTDGLNEDTYAYLAAKGISKSAVKRIEAMAATERDAQTKSVKEHDQKLFTAAGGPDELSKALEWGKKGGYTEAQQKRFNDITKGKDYDAKEEAVLALMARYRAANPPAKPKLPKRDATKGQGSKAPEVKPYKDRAEMKAFRDSLKPNDKAGWAIHNARRKITNFE